MPMDQQRVDGYYTVAVLIFRGSHVTTNSISEVLCQNPDSDTQPKSDNKLGRKMWRICGPRYQIGTMKILKGWVALWIFCFNWLQGAALSLLEIVFQAWKNKLSANHPYEHGRAMRGQHRSMETYLYPWTSLNCLKWWTGFLPIIYISLLQHCGFEASIFARMNSLPSESLER